MSESSRRLWLAIMLLTLPVLSGAMAMDMLLPALPNMGTGLGLSPAQIQWTLNVFILGFALCQLLVGVIATRLGNRTMLLAAAILYIISSGMTGVSSSWTLILILRFLQALASCTMLVISMALITQTFHRDQVTRGHSILSGVTSLGPLLAPIIGAAIINMGGSWRSIFYTLSLFGAVILMLFIRPGSLFNWHQPPVRQQSYGRIAKSPAFWRYATYSSAGMCWIFLFFSTTPFIVHSVWQRGPWSLALIFALASSCFLVGSYLGSRTDHLPTRNRRFNIALTVQFVLAGLLLLFSLSFPLPFAMFVGWIMLMQINCGLYFGPAISAALQQFPDIPVQAAAFQGFQQFISTFVITSILLMLFKHTITDLSMMVLIVTSIASGMILLIKHKYGV